MISPSRIRVLNEKPLHRGRYVVYWMQQSQRADWNHALEYAIEQANDLHLPVVVFFGLTPSYPEANRRHYVFMLQGLIETQRMLESRGIATIVRKGDPSKEILEIALDAAMVVVDAGYLRIQRQWRATTASHLSCRMVQVESDVVVPVAVASEKEDFAAATIRPKILRVLDEYMVPIIPIRVKKDSLGLRIRSEDISDPAKVVSVLGVDASVKEVGWIQGGSSHAQERLATFLATKLDTFGELRNDPSKDNLSNLSPYLHFGQISALQIALDARARRSRGGPPFLEELIVRRELSMNFVYYNSRYDLYDGLPDWARRTLDAHRKDKRPILFSLQQLESASTYDPYWNAAQRELVYLGKMHGYMRMYWGKKILEWTPDPVTAHKITLYLNDTYSIDGRDANGYTGVAWCLGKHDRAWAERPIFGKIRYMNDRGLLRKFDIDQYVTIVNERISQERTRIEPTSPSPTAPKTRKSPKRIRIPA